MEYYEVAAKWWADQLRDGNARTKKSVIGDGSYADQLLTLQGIAEALDDNTPSENIDVFEKLLAKRIKEVVEKKGGMALVVYFGPDLILEEIARETGCSTARFPGRAEMDIWKELVRVKVGYGANEVTIFSAKSEGK